MRNLHTLALWILIGLSGTVAHAQITNLTDFQDCIGPNTEGWGTTCHLAPGTYSVTSTLNISRPGITITGTMSGGLADTVLQRGSPAIAPIMNPVYGATGVVIEYLTFDGNRCGAGGMSCLPANYAGLADLDLGRYNASVAVEWDDFINAPGTALLLGTNSTVSTSNFGQGGYGIGSSGSYGYESAPQTATRSTAVFFYQYVGDDSNLYRNSGGGAWYNAIAYAGTSGISLNSSYEYAYGNLLQENRYELSDGIAGGQLYVGTLSPGDIANNDTVAGNVINGNYWPIGQTSVATGCTLASGQFTTGVESYGTGQRFYNNEIEQHSGAGMQFAGSNPTQDITISSSNPWDASDTPRYIEANANAGIVFLGPHTPYHTAAVGVTLDDVLVRNNASYSVVLDGVSIDGSYQGFINDACISGNSENGQNMDVPPPWSTLTYPTPGTYPADYQIYRGSSCPQPGWASQTPAPSHIPGWPW